MIRGEVQQNKHIYAKINIFKSNFYRPIIGNSAHSAKVYTFTRKAYNETNTFRSLLVLITI